MVNESDSKVADKLALKLDKFRHTSMLPQTLSQVLKSVTIVPPEAHEVRR
jgi:hypothetical protein